jgi:hypothetical protein
VRLLDEVAEHLLGGLEVRDHAVTHRLDRRDRPGVRPSISLASVPTASTVSLMLLKATIEGSLRHDASAAGKHARIGGAEVDREIIGQNCKAPSNT